MSIIYVVSRQQQEIDYSIHNDLKAFFSKKEAENYVADQISIQKKEVKKQHIIRSKIKILPYSSVDEYYELLSQLSSLLYVEEDIFVINAIYLVDNTQYKQEKAINHGNQY